MDTTMLTLKNRWKNTERRMRLWCDLFFSTRKPKEKIIINIYADRDGGMLMDDAAIHMCLCMTTQNDCDQFRLEKLKRSELHSESD